MNDESMTKEQLLDELRVLRKEVDRFRKADAERDGYVKELKERGQFLAGILEASPIVFTITRRKDGRFMLVSPAHGRESGYSPKEVLGKTSLELNMYTSKANRDAFVKILEETGELNNFEVQYRNKNGSVRDVLLYARPLVYEGEECMLTASLPITERKQAEQKIATYRDHLEELVKERTADLASEITERKQAEDELASSEEFLNSVIEQSPASLWISDSEGTMIKMNQSCRELFGATDEEAVGEYNLLKDNLIEEQGFMPRVENVFKKGEIAQFTIDYDLPSVEHVKVNGATRRILDVIVSPIKNMHGKVTNAVVQHKDITELKRAEEALRKSEEKYRNIFNNAQVGIFRTRISDGKVIECNDRFARTYGYKTPEECIDNFVVSERYTDPGVREKMVAFLMEKGEVNDREACFSRKDGNDVWIRFSACAYPEEGYLEGVGYDITEEKKALGALRESEKRYRTLVDNLPVAICRTTPGPAGKFLMANPAFCKMLGFKNEEEVKKVTPAEVYSNPRERKILSDKIQEQGIVNNAERTLLKRDGTPVYVSITVSLTDGKDVEATHFDTIMFDITEQKKLEGQLLQAQKMEAIGTLAGGVAHDLNNILGGLVSYPELLLLQLPEGSPLRKSILTIQKSGEKAAAVVEDLLTLARRGVVVTEVVNLNDVISEYLKSPEHENLQSYHAGVHLETHLEKDTLNILGSSIHLSKTVMNLVSNAAEAMPQGGNLTVSTENRYIDRPIRDYDNVKEGDYVVLTIADTGTGISPNDIEKIFEPFYTKKKMGRSGTGLGMAVVWGTVKDHNGYIDVQSTEGTGTTFTLYFPVTRERLPEDKPSLTVESYSGNGESILIVDDVEEQRKIASGMLKELGYSVVSVSSGEEAVEYLKTNKVDLLGSPPNQLAKAWQIFNVK